MQRQPQESISGDQLEMFLVVAFALFMPNGMPLCKKKNYNSMKRLQGKDLEDSPAFKYQPQAIKNPFKMKGCFFKMEGLVILKFHILPSSGKGS
jgi:hypothetical protein